MPPDHHLAPRQAFLHVLDLLMEIAAIGEIEGSRPPRGYDRGVQANIAMTMGFVLGKLSVPGCQPEIDGAVCSCVGRGFVDQGGMKLKLFGEIALARPAERA